MTNEERLHKLNEAERLIREVEFSYPQGDEIRRRIYCSIVSTFSYMGELNPVIDGLKAKIKEERLERVEKSKDAVRRLNDFSYLDESQEKSKKEQND